MYSSHLKMVSSKLDVLMKKVKMMIENEHFNCVKMVSCKVMTIENQKGYRWHKGALGRFLGSVGAVRVCQGM